MTHIFKRKLYDRMLNWKKLSNESSALLIQGARRVGKSTLAEYFAQIEYVEDSMVVNRSHHANDRGVDMTFNMDLRQESTCLD